MQLPTAILPHDHALLGLWPWPSSLPFDETAGGGRRIIGSPVASISPNQPQCSFMCPFDPWQCATPASVLEDD